MQTILGAGGSVANHLALELPGYTNHIRLVSRNPKKINDADEIFAADLLDKKQVEAAVKGSSIVYLTAGLPYNSTVWERDWRPLMENVIEACKIHQAKLVFFDNVYMYGKVKREMTETTPFNPVSKKGVVRAAVASMLLKAMDEKSLTAMIVRSSDFIGADTQNSVPNMLVIDKLKAGKKAQLFLTDKTVHNYTYLKDATKAMAMLANTSEAYGQTWHLPSTGIFTGKDFVGKVAEILKVKSHYTIAPRWLLGVLGLFIPAIKETQEMLYLNEQDYEFSDAKFMKAFPEFKKTAFEDIIKQMA
ncbi:MAG: NAD-dependent epimerase/dehydratase family protein [Gloeobacteraceae cyanobacterium ES-bin-316]|nr:NAD-dependent epimerase/dehydratase family protein [Ferruginibacter sp.]